MMVEDLGMGEELGVFSRTLLFLFISKMPLAWSLTGQLLKCWCLFPQTGIFSFLLVCRWQFVAVSLKPWLHYEQKLLLRG